MRAKNGETRKMFTCEGCGGRFRPAEVQHHNCRGGKDGLADQASEIDRARMLLHELSLPIAKASLAAHVLDGMRRLGRKEAAEICRQLADDIHDSHTADFARAIRQVLDYAAEKITKYDAAKK